nr:hypothetical protein CFP56_62811 [Quercus suber]
MGRSKGPAPKDTLGSKLPPLAPAPSVNPFVPANLKNRKKDKDVAEDGELVPYNEGVSPKLPKMAKGKGRASSVESKEAKHVAERTKDKDVAEDGELVPYNEGVSPKLPKMAMGKGRASSVESKEAKHVVEGRTWPEDKDKGKEAKTLPENKGPEDVQGKDAAPKTKGSELVKPQAVAREKKTTSGKATDSTIS